MSLPRSFWVFLGVAEIAAAIGLTLPGLTRVMPLLVSWAAVGIMIVMISATGYHIVRGENGPAATTFVLLIMATYVAYQRSRVLPIAPEKPRLKGQWLTADAGATPRRSRSSTSPRTGGTATSSSR